MVRKSERNQTHVGWAGELAKCRCYCSKSTDIRLPDTRDRVARYLSVCCFQEKGTIERHSSAILWAHLLETVWAWWGDL
jgi:hypothetical protein